MSVLNDVLNSEILKEKLNEAVEVYYYPSIDSTNNQAKRLIAEGKAQRMLVVSDEQTAGRGRQGKSFYSPNKTGIYMSFVFKPSEEFESAVSCTTAASVAVCRAIESKTELKPQIKWVNDIYLGNKKICGILCEAINGSEANKISEIVVGIGLNIKTAEFPDDVENASCLGVDIARADLIAEITEQLIKTVNTPYSSFIEYYRAHSLIIGRDICFIQNGVSTNAKALQIENDGGLTVLLENGETKTLRSGEISIRRI
ncbi:MAG: biotin--[acetyl-CoA-carboxylase] ligase [Ruminococcaceae bacterium]|nr:biotin--[acetyl-CoA-carboxylase] ligase [Oscillospiraceae bacterium]